MKRRDFIKKSVQTGATALIGSTALGCAEDSGSDSSSILTEDYEGIIIYQKISNPSARAVAEVTSKNQISSSSDVTYASRETLCIYNPDTREAIATSLETNNTNSRGFSLSSDFTTAAHQSSTDEKCLCESNISDSENTEITDSTTNHSIRDVRYSSDDTLMYSGYYSSGTNYYIWFVDPDTATIPDGHQPTWARDNNHIAYLNNSGRICYNDKSDSGEISSQYYNTDGGSIECLSWSPTEDKIAFITTTSGNDVYLKTIDRNTADQVYVDHHLGNSFTNGPGSVQFSPDGKQIGYAADGNIHTYDYDSIESTLSNKTTFSGISDVRVFEWRTKKTES